WGQEQQFPDSFAPCAATPGENLPSPQKNHSDSDQGREISEGNEADEDRGHKGHAHILPSTEQGENR
ncbi:hypothetical protein, partial [Pseudactinotalea sp.]|uniref:hypothetical protein n=1 Tax=Pseudactinotalea sp. TaxID=1926260 RepID=UPI003B3A6311